MTKKSRKKLTKKKIEQLVERRKVLRLIDKQAAMAAGIIMDAAIRDQARIDHARDDLNIAIKHAAASRSSAMIAAEYAASFRREDLVWISELSSEEAQQFLSRPGNRRKYQSRNRRLKPRHLESVYD